jgi:hypothetical protein
VAPLLDRQLSLRPNEAQQSGDGNDNDNDNDATSR